MRDATRPWLAHYDPKVKPELDYPELPLFALLDRAARDHPQRTALVFKNARLNYAELLEKAETLAANLARLGVVKGDRVAIMLPNLPQAVIAYFGALKAGAAVVWINPLYMRVELDHILSDSRPKVLVVLDLLYEAHKAIFAAQSIPVTVVTRVGQALAFPLNLLYPLKARREGRYPAIARDVPGLLPWKRLLGGRERLSVTDVDPRADVAVLQYTGGTTGLSKGCMLSHFNLMANVRQCQAMMHAIGEHFECFLGVLPYFHIYGLTVCVNFAVSLASTLAPIPRFVPAEVLAAVARTRPTVFPGTPSVYMALMRQKEATRELLASIRFCVSGSAPMPHDMLRQFTDLTGAEILEGYGLTEASPITHVNPLAAPRKNGSIGLPFPDTLARIVDMETGSRALAPGEKGELTIKGPQVMLGYWNRPEDTAETLRDGWLRTGDLAVMDEDGFFFILDRKKDLIISGGYNIYPREIEEALTSHPMIKEAAAVGVPHPTRGEAVKVFIVPEPGQAPTRQEITDFLRQRLANYKVPKYVEFRDDLPRTLVGKVLKRALREEPKAKPHAAPPQDGAASAAGTAP